MIENWDNIGYLHIVLKSDLRGIETYQHCSGPNRPHRGRLKSDLRGIETMKTTGSVEKTNTLKSDLRGIETSFL